jgi:outer membrane protein assembly factor BamD (BamD/ComL family)
LLAVVICIPTACAHRTSAQIRAKHHDEMLFERATAAIQQQRFTIANVMLRTLVATYPDSEYADRARLMLQDPRIARCGEGFSTTPDLCDPPKAISAH